jgi:tetracycline repressor-like protein
MRERAIAVRATLLRHPWAIGLMESRRRPGPATLRHHDAMLGCLRRGGFSVPHAAHAYSLLDSYISALRSMSSRCRSRRLRTWPKLARVCSSTSRHTRIQA